MLARKICIEYEVAKKPTKTHLVGPFETWQFSAVRLKLQSIITRHINVYTPGDF